MCQYCSKVFTRERNDNLVKLGIDVNGFTMFGVQTCIETEDEKAFINTYLTDQFGRCFTSKATEIQYCPVCGRKLEKEEP